MFSISLQTLQLLKKSKPHANQLKQQDQPSKGFITDAYIYADIDIHTQTNKRFA